jgi:hypothetical protein
MASNETYSFGNPLAPDQNANVSIDSFSSVECFVVSVPRFPLVCYGWQQYVFPEQTRNFRFLVYG